MPFPRFDIAESGEGRFVLARLVNDNADAHSDDMVTCEIIGVFASETEARIELLRILSTPSPAPEAPEIRGLSH